MEVQSTYLPICQLYFLTQAISKYLSDHVVYTFRVGICLCSTLNIFFNLQKIKHLSLVFLIIMHPINSQHKQLSEKVLKIFSTIKIHIVKVFKKFTCSLKIQNAKGSVVKDNIQMDFKKLITRCIVFYLSYSAFLYKWLNLKHVILVILVVLTEEFDRSNSVGTSKSVPCAALAAAAAACCCLCCLAFFITLKL